ncbi:MAG TPA: hypothetical protein VGF76_16245 [Polyangiaceae bacterium]
MITDGNYKNEMWLGQFLALPLDEKIRYILSRDVEFFNGDALVDRKIALAALRKRQAAR